MIEGDGDILMKDSRADEISKTERLLPVFHLLICCKEVSFKEVTDQIPVSKKTVYRDMRLLRQIGWDINFSRERGAFVMSRERAAPQFPENKTQRMYMEKILRLAILMTEMIAAKDPAAWYRERFPKLSARTMQRDFRMLNGIGYQIKYQREIDERQEREVGKYYCEWPASTYGLDVFYRSK
jgi:predicted DNA-binding transcriptional regulator YafY